MRVNAAQYILTCGIRFYRWAISPALAAVFGPLAGCRFTPTCSAYALEAIRVHGALAGSWLAIKRLCRCHPWGGCGDDPVPPKTTDATPRKSWHPDPDSGEQRVGNHC